MKFDYRAIFRMSVPIFLGLLAQNIINVTDTAFLGRVGKVELGASVMGGLFYYCLFTIAFGFSSGAQIVMARRHGEGRCGEMGAVLWQGVAFLLLLAVVFCGLTYGGGGYVMRRLVHSDEVYAAAMTYLNYRMVGIFFASFTVMFRAFYVSLGRTRVLTWASVVMAVVNIVLDYLLIFGKCGFPQWGLAGAAVASVVAEAVTALFMWGYTRRRLPGERYGLWRFRLQSATEVRRVLRLSSFTMLQFFFSNLTYFFFFIAVEHLGELPLAVANIVRSCYVVLLIPIQALAATAHSMVSNLIGQGGKDRVVALLRRITGVSVAMVTVLVVAVGVVPRAVLHIYTPKAEIVEWALPSLYMVLFGALMSAVSMIYFAGISGTGNTRRALWLEVGASAVYVGYIVVVGCWWQAGVAWCFGCEPLYYALIGVASVGYLRRGNWRQCVV